MFDKPVIFWFRRNLRIADNPGLYAATKTGRPVIPLYILDKNAGSPPGGASHWWLSLSLAQLDAELKQYGSCLVLRKGEFGKEVKRLAEETGASAVHFTRGYEPDIVSLEDRLKYELVDAGTACTRFGGQLLIEPEDVASTSGEPYRVFTPFYKACLGKEPIREVVATPREFRAPGQWPDSDRLRDWKLEPSTPDWASEMRQFWTPGEEGAKRRLKAFFDVGLEDYADKRDRPDLDGTSCLSPHLAFGEISPRQIWHAIRHAAERNSDLGSGAKSFIRELYWREFSAHLLFHWPSLPEKPFRAEFVYLPWQSDKEKLRAWQKGRTGYPIVDAGMRQLWALGWMHNRVRMIAASLLTKHLLIHWRKGAAWFQDTLVDADLANNSASWQWIAGAGADAAPYFRIFNPILQGRKFDPEGNYVRQWVPELSSLSKEHIHAPWNAPDSLLEKAGITLGKDYPYPVIEHKKGREQALKAYEAMKAAANP